MTRSTIAQLRKNKGDKWRKLKAEFDKFPEGSTTSQKLVASTATVYNATPGATITTGLSTITGFGFAVITPVTPAGGVFVNCTPTAAGNLIASVTPVDAKISYFAIGT